jgi:hypothetical protein
MTMTTMWVLVFELEFDFFKGPMSHLRLRLGHIGGVHVDDDGANDDDTLI